jgi:flagellar biosynthetic protein FlhB
LTKQEVREEMKQSEGDPLIKGRIRQIQRQMAMRRMMQEVPKADVVITNPTHVAVALKYDQDKMFAPVVVAKGYDATAQRIKAIAAEHHITQVENVDLARALAKEVEIGRAIPTKWYQAVAEILSMIYKLKRKAG